MKSEFDLREWVLLTTTKGVGPAAVRDLLAAFGSPGAARRAPLAELCKCVPEKTAASIQRGGGEKEADIAVQWAARSQCRILTLADADYPPMLLSLGDNPPPPPLLYVRGNVGALTARPLLAIVGSRSASAAGVNNAEVFARKLSESGINIVSGMAEGIDAAAHRGALDGGGTTVAVVGTGVDIVYPKRNRTLAMDIVRGGGAIVGELPLGTPPDNYNFPNRNRIISGLSRGCLVVEAARKSGSLITAQLALEQGREVFAVPGSINAPLHQGCHALIKTGAKLTENVADIFEELNLTPRSRESLPSSSPEEAGGVLKWIDFEPTALDDIAARSGKSAGELLPDLLALEMDGKIVPAVGGAYQRI